MFQLALALKKPMTSNIMTNNPVSNDTLDKAKNTKLLALDVDGVMTDGSVYFTAQGDEIKAFSILDGQGIKALLRNNIEVAIITGRTSPLTARRARDLGIENILQGREDKKVALQELSTQLGIAFSDITYMGDDLPDLSAITHSGFGVTVPNAHNFVQKHADHCTTLAGGKGAVREVCDLILKAKGLLANIQDSYLN
jgi:3-deoxy-D-manno-octulosonate 8-phosphate phosphatase (KDO 8-P phosphatase)